MLVVDSCIAVLAVAVVVSIFLDIEEEIYVVDGLVAFILVFVVVAVDAELLPVIAE